jgi:hypothetical protein
LRKTTGATSAHKQKIRSYIQTGEHDDSLTDWLSVVVDPRFGLFQETVRLTGEVQELENQNRLTSDPALERDFRTGVKELAGGKYSDREVYGVN